LLEVAQDGGTENGGDEDGTKASELHVAKRERVGTVEQNLAGADGPEVVNGSLKER
jgi:hypothetical protein